MNHRTEPCRANQGSLNFAVRLLPFAFGDGPRNMAADEVMLESAVEGVASLRLYGWDPPTLSLGYFQKHEERRADPKLAAMPWIRRATGGGAIIHDRDLTYAVAIPASHRQGLKPDEWHCRIHKALTQLLQQSHIAAEVKTGQRKPQAELGFLCFAVPQPGDVILGETKIIGGAQRVRAGALLQHGSIQLPDLTPGEPEASTPGVPSDHMEPDKLTRELAAVLGWIPEPCQWTDAERARIEELAKSKYGQDAWNRKR